MLDREDTSSISDRQKSLLKYTFTVTSGSDLGKGFTIGTFPVYIGRDSDSLILLSGDLGISRKHAEIYERDGAIRIRDLKSTHGTQVNGQRIDDKNLVSGDRIQVGRTVLVVKADGG
jgi:pSer/pThr/pTyr-binding forkhead associated (FHA) protein